MRQELSLIDKCNCHVTSCLFAGPFLSYGKKPMFSSLKVEKQYQIDIAKS